jgi:hypothetical protein
VEIWVVEEDGKGLTYRELREQTERRTTWPLFGKSGSRFAPLGICSPLDRATLVSRIPPGKPIRRLLEWWRLL